MAPGVTFEERRAAARAGAGATRVAVPAEEPLIGKRYDYADAFEIGLRASDPRSPEEFARHALERAPRSVQWTISTVHRYVLRLRLAPRSAPGHVLGWRIVTSEPDVIQLEALSPLLGRGVIVARRPEPTRAVVTTYLFHSRPVPARALWAVVGPLHRRIAPYLMARAAAVRP
jgi:hypothetical protein